jgi:hypothetical protein
VHFQAASGTAQTISFSALSSVPMGSSLSLSATATSGLAVTFTSQSSSVCSVSGNQVTTLAVGTCIIAADQPGDVGYWLAASTVTRSFSVTALPQTIGFTAPGSVTVGTPVTLSATATSGLSVTFASQTVTVCSVTGNQVATLALGTCTIDADQAGDASWLAAPTVSRSFAVVTGLSQTINFPSIADVALGSAPFAVSATATSGLTVSIASQTGNICSINSGTVTLIAAGTCTLVATQPGNATYAAAPTVVRSFAVSSSTSGPIDSDADAPLPMWAMMLLGLILLGTLQRAQRVS